MKVSRTFVRHWLQVLVREKLLSLCLVFASGTSLVIQSIATQTFSWPHLVPISLLLVYTGVHLRSVTRLAQQTWRAIPLPYSVCLGQSRDWYEAAIRQQEQTLQSTRIAWEDIQRTYRVHRIDWAYFHEGRLSLSAAAWKDGVGNIVRHFEHLTNRIPIQPVFHMFFAAPAPLTLALGARIGRRLPVNVYQHAGMVHNPYVRVFSSEEISQDEGYHLLNKRVSEYSLIDVRASSGNDNDARNNRVLMILDFTGHDLPKPFPLSDAAETLFVQLKSAKGHIPLNASWIDLAHEISSAVFAKVDEDKEVHLLPGIPSSLAFIVGTVVGAIPGVVVYHYNRHDSSYTDGFMLNEL